MKAKIETFFIAVILVFTGGIGLLTLDNREPKSLMENRNYAQFPELHFRSFADAKYIGKIADAFSDQLQYREFFVHTYFNLQYRVGGITSLGGTVIGRDGRLFGAPYLPNSLEEREKEILDTAEMVNREARKIAETGAKFIYLYYPRKDTAMASYLPWYYPGSREAAEGELLRAHLSDDVVFIDCCRLFLEHEPRQDFFYQTDHHPNFDGQLLVYQELMKVVGEDYPDLPVYTREDYILARNWMDGSYNRNIGRIIRQEPEYMNVVEAPPVSYVRWDNGKPSDTPVFGDGNTYSDLFMGNDIANTVIETDLTDAPSFLISGSSFTNPIEALILPDCSRMESLDYRHFKEKKTLAEIAAASGADYVVLSPTHSGSSVRLSLVKRHLGLSQ